VLKENSAPTIIVQDYEDRVKTFEDDVEVGVGVLAVHLVWQTIRIDFDLVGEELHPNQHVDIREDQEEETKRLHVLQYLRDRNNHLVQLRPGPCKLKDSQQPKCPNCNERITGLDLNAVLH